MEFKDNIEIIPEKVNKQKSKLKKGRFDTPVYVEYIRNKFKEKFPDDVPHDFIISHCVDYFWQYVIDALIKDETVTVIKYGKFWANKRWHWKIKQDQYYIKFTPTQSAQLKLREAKGTLTENEKTSLLNRRLKMKEIWDARKLSYLKRVGKLPPSIQEKAYIANNVLTEFEQNVRKLENDIEERYIKNMEKSEEEN